MKRLVVAVLVSVAAIFPVSAIGATTSYDSNGTFLLAGAKVFPIGLTLPPPLGGTTPSGTDGLNEVVSAGVNFLRAGAFNAPWTDAVLADAQAWDREAAARGVHTWINLRELARAQPGTTDEAMLKKVVTTLKDDAGMGLWKGADEPWWNGWPPSLLTYAYCLTTSRGDPTWCDKTQSMDPNHLWVTIQAPRGTASDLQPYSAVTDTHGVAVYPIGINVANPDLHQVGTWTQTIASITPNHNVWTTLQICHSGSFAPESGEFVLPTKKQERYMIYDAIINGARALNFFGGQNPNCWNSTDAALGWNWTFWNTVLKSLILEIGPTSPLYPALLSPDPATDLGLTTNDSTTQVIRRQVGTDMWVMAARSGNGTMNVTISGLPTSISSGTVYAEGRSISVRDGSFTDSFSQWDVHVYRFNNDTTPPSAPTNLTAPAVSSTQVDLSWTAASDNVGVTGYRIERNGAPLTTVGAVTSYADTSVAAGTTYSYSVKAVDAAGNISAASNTVTVTTPAAADFSLSASPASQTVVRGNSVSYAITVSATGGFSGSVMLSVSVLPSGPSASFSPNPVSVPSNGSASSVLSVTTSAQTKTGTYTITITGTDPSGRTRTTAVTLQVKRK